MRYRFSVPSKQEAIQKNRKGLTLQYGLVAIGLAFVLITKFSVLELSVKIPLVLALFMLPVAWWYFDRNMKHRLATEYEVDSDVLIVFAHKKQVNKIRLDSIREVKELPLAYRIQSTYGDYHILKGGHNIEHLLKEIKEKTHPNTIYK